MPNSLTCWICGKSYSHSGTLNRHLRTVHHIELPRDTRDHGYHPYHLPTPRGSDFYEAPPSDQPDGLIDYVGRQLAEIYPNLDLGQPSPHLSAPDQQEQNPPDRQATEYLPY